VDKRSEGNNILGTSKVDSITTYLGPFLKLVCTWLPSVPVCYTWINSSKDVRKIPCFSLTNSPD